MVHDINGKLIERRIMVCWIWRQKWPWMILNPDFKGTTLFDVEYTRNGKRYKVTMEY